MAVQFIQSLGITGVNVQLNTLGDEASRPRYREALVEYFRKYEENLCGDCSRRLDTNPLRILDCKKTQCGEIAEHAPCVHDYLSDEAQRHFDETKRLLDRNKTPYTVVPQMVRGLDYYTRTIFEVQIDSGALGAQTAILGGGRYDNLIQQLGGRPTPAIGFSFGMERLLMVLGEDARVQTDPLLFVAGVGNDGLERALDLSRQMRQKGYRVELSYTCGSLRSQLKRADRLGASLTIIAGEDEAKRGAVTLRSMKDGRQQEIALIDLEKHVEENL